MKSRKTRTGKNASRSKLSAWTILLLLIILTVSFGIYYATRQPDSQPQPPQSVSNSSEPSTYTAKHTAAFHEDALKICSFNIQFLGNSKDRDNNALASILNPYDIVVVQELVAPPYPGMFPNGESFRPDPEAAKFFNAMRELGFEYILSEEDTGTGDEIHSNGTSTEWFVTFFRPTVLRKLPICLRASLLKIDQTIVTTSEFRMLLLFVQSMKNLTLC